MSQKRNKIIVLISVMLSIILIIFVVKSKMPNLSELSVKDLQKCYQMQKENSELSHLIYSYCYKDFWGRLKISKIIPTKINDKNSLIIVINTPELFKDESLKGLKGGRLAYTRFLWDGGITSVCVSMLNILQETGLMPLQQDIRGNYRIKDGYFYFCSSFENNNLKRFPLIIGGKPNTFRLSNIVKPENPKIFVDYGIPIREGTVDYFVNNSNSYVLISQ